MNPLFHLKNSDSCEISVFLELSKNKAMNLIHSAHSSMMTLWQNPKAQSNDPSASLTQPWAWRTPQSVTTLPPSISADNASMCVPTSLTLEALARQHLQFVWRCLRRFGLSEADAEDGVQEVFIVVQRKLSLIHAGKELSFLISVARRVASSKVRSITRRREELPSSERPAIAKGHSPEELHSLREARNQLDQILETMSDDVRVVFMLYEVERMTTNEIAESLEIPSGTVSTRLRRGRQIFSTAVNRLKAQRRTI